MNQDGPVENQDPSKKTEHRITGTDHPGRRIRTAQSEVKIVAKRQNIASLGQILRGEKSGRSKNRQTLNIGHCNVKKHLGSEGLSSPRRKERRKTLKHKLLYTQKPYLVHISRFERISRFTPKAVLIRTQ